MVQMNRCMGVTEAEKKIPVRRPQRVVIAISSVLGKSSGPVDGLNRVEDAPQEVWMNL